MTLLHKGLWAGLLASGLALVAGLVLLLGAALVAGDWFLAPQPWIGTGLTLITAGLAGGALCSVALDMVEPIGLWRVVAIPPAAIVGTFWAFVLLVGLPTTGGPDVDVPTVLYSLPMVLALLVVLTTAMALPVLVGRLVRRGGRMPASSRRSPAG